MYTRDRADPTTEIGGSGYLFGSNQWLTNAPLWIQPQIAEEDESVARNALSTDEDIVKAITERTSSLPDLTSMAMAIAASSPHALISSRPVAENARRRASGDIRFGYSIAGTKGTGPFLEAVALQFMTAYDAALRTYALKTRASQQAEDLELIPRVYDREKKSDSATTASADAARAWFAERARLAVKYVESQDKEGLPISLVDIGALLVAGPEGLLTKKIVTHFGTKAATMLNIGAFLKDIDFSEIGS